MSTREQELEQELEHPLTALTDANNELERAKELEEELQIKEKDIAHLHTKLSAARRTARDTHAAHEADSCDRNRQTKQDTETIHLLKAQNAQLSNNRTSYIRYHYGQAHRAVKGHGRQGQAC
jgi:uncharacterized protein YhaN